MKTAVVTGGAGAIGSRLVRRLLDAEFSRVVVVDDLSSGYEWLLPAEDRVEFLRMRVQDLPQSGFRADGSTVFHLAAFFANQNSVDHPFDDLETNGRGTLAVLEWARLNNVARLIYASAGCSIVEHGEDAPIREDMPVSLWLDTPYQITKALGEFYCNYYLASVPSVRARFFNSFGPGEVPGPYRNVIPNFISCALAGRPLVITGTGNETRDFIYVDDLCDGLIACSDAPEAVGEAFNLGTGNETTIRELAKMIIEACGSSSPIEFTDRRPWDRSLRRQAEIAKAEKILNFSPRITVREGIERTVEWFRDNQIHLDASARGRA